MHAAQTFYAPLVNPRTNAQIFPGLEHGGGLLWGEQTLNDGMVDQSKLRPRGVARCSRLLGSELELQDV